MLQGLQLFISLLQRTQKLANISGHYEIANFNFKLHTHLF